LSLTVNGFCKEVLKQQPMEFAMEARKLFAFSLDGSVGCHGTIAAGYSQAFKSLNSFPVGYQEASLMLIAIGVPRRREARRPARSSSVAPFGDTKDSARDQRKAQ